MTTQTLDPYGRGWAFPPSFNVLTGIGMVEGADDVREAMQLLLMTLPGQRIMRPDYGCDLEEFLFQNIQSPMIGAITGRIVDAVLDYEPRVVLNAVVVDQDDADPNCITIKVLYRLRATGDEDQIQWKLDIGDGNGGNAA